MSIVVQEESFGDPLTDAQKEQLWAEGLRWYSMYGMTMRGLPQDWASFQRYWDHMCARVLEDNAATRAACSGYRPDPDSRQHPDRP
jgi:uncharacterized protein (DUF2236 family)